MIDEVDLICDVRESGLGARAYPRRSRRSSAAKAHRRQRATCPGGRRRRHRGERRKMRRRRRTAWWPAPPVQGRGKAPTRQYPRPQGRLKPAMTGLHTDPSIPPQTRPAWSRPTPGAAPRGQAEWFGSPSPPGLKGPRPAGPPPPARSQARQPHGRGPAFGPLRLCRRRLTWARRDPFDRPIHRALARNCTGFDWMATCSPGERESVKPALAPLAGVFATGTPSPGATLLERRAFNLSCALRRISSRARTWRPTVAGVSPARAAAPEDQPRPVRAARARLRRSRRRRAWRGTRASGSGKAWPPRPDLVADRAADGGHASRSPEPAWSCCSIFSP